MRPFLLQSGFHPNKTRFVPVAAMEGINLAQAAPKASPLNQWYKGPTLVNLLGAPPWSILPERHAHSCSIDTLDPPTRDINAPLRFPISNVFKGQTSGISVSGRVCGGIIVAGERLRIVPGDESATVRGELTMHTRTLSTQLTSGLAIDSDGDGLPWAGAGSNVNLTLTGVDPISLNIGSVLCRPSHVVPLSSTFTARIIVFDIQMPITAGASVSTLRTFRPQTSYNLVRWNSSTTLETFQLPYRA